jgi:hypothetical protein
MALRSYRGYRHGHVHTLDGEWQVFFVDAKRLMTELPQRNDLANHSAAGFAWGYAGSGPAQLALALLAHHLNDDVEALRLHQLFKEAVIVSMDQEADWTLSVDNINSGIAAAEGIP